MPKDATTCLLCAHYTEEGECQAHPPAMVPHLIQPAPEGGGAWLIHSIPLYPTPDPSYRCDEYAPAFRRQEEPATEPGRVYVGGLSVRAGLTLERLGLQSSRRGPYMDRANLAKLANYGTARLRRVKGCGPRTIEELAALCHAHGLTLSGAPIDDEADDEADDEPAAFHFQALPE